MQVSALLLAAGLAVMQAPPTEVVLPNCLVSLIDEAQVPAQEAGVLTNIKAREGQPVEAGELLAQIDDTKSKMEQRVAMSKLAVAKEKAQDDINVRYATAETAVAEAEYQVNMEANRKVPNSVTQVELNKLLLQWKKSSLSIDKAKLDLRVAGHEANVAQTEVDATAENIDRRKIESPLSGVVVEMHHHLGEWVQPGDQVFHVVRMDRLWVEGYIDASKFNRSEIQGRPVTVKVELARGQTESFDGKVVFVKPLTEAGGTYLVRAEVANRKEAGHWILSPGINAQMTIDLK